MKQCLALFAVTKGWLLFDIRWFVLLLLYTVNMVIFAGGKFRENFGKTFHKGVIFTILLIFPSYGHMGFYFCVGEIFAKKTKAQKRVNYPHTKISTFTAVYFNAGNFNFCFVRVTVADCCFKTIECSVFYLQSKRTDCNHIFLNFAPTLTLPEPGKVSCFQFMLNFSFYKVTLLYFCHTLTISHYIPDKQSLGGI